MSRAVFVSRYGGPDVLDIVWRPLPPAGPGDVLIETEAAGAAYADVLMRQGRYPGGPRPPFVPGWDVMGRVIWAGPAADPGLLGRRVLALPLSGAVAEHVVAPAERTVPLPDGVDPFEAACLTMNYVTAWQMLRLAGAEAGQTLLVHGAAGGVGSAILDLARVLSLHAFAAASSAHAEAVAELGGDFIDRGLQDPSEVVARAGGVDMVFDPLGGPNTRKSFRALKPGGRLVSYGFMAAGRGSPVVSAVRQMVELRLRSFGSRKGRFYRLSDSVRRDPKTFRADLVALLDLLHAGRITPAIADLLPLSDVARAHRRLEDGAVTGRLLLTPDFRDDGTGSDGASGSEAPGQDPKRAGRRPLPVSTRADPAPPRPERPQRPPTSWTPSSV